MAGKAGAVQTLNNLVPVANFFPWHDFETDNRWQKMVAEYDPIDVEFAKAYIATGASSTGTALRLIFPDIPAHSSRSLGGVRLKKPSVKNMVTHLSSLKNESDHKPVSMEEIVVDFEKMYRDQKDPKLKAELGRDIVKWRKLDMGKVQSTDEFESKEARSVIDALLKQTSERDKRAASVPDPNN
jgi:hypothetical protein